MASIGQLLGGAGVVAGGMRQAEEAERVAQQNQLATEEQNRLARLKRQMAGYQPPAFEQAAIPSFTRQITPGERMEVEGVTAPQTPSAGLSGAPASAPTGASVGQPSTTPTGQPPPVTSAQQQKTPAELAYERMKGNFAAIQVAGRGMSKDELIQVYALSLRQNNLDFATRLEPYLTTRHKMSQKELNNIRRQMSQIRRMTGEDPNLLERAGNFFGFGERAKTERAAREQQQLAQLRAPAAPAAPAAPTAPATGNTSQYDKPTKYDELLNRSAQQYGLDPVLFKRLIGTESSFNPQAVSPRGESFGLGIAQIADVHGLTPEQRLDPNTAIPKAAEILKRYLDASGGDYQRAILQYKGASSPAGISSMQAVINRDIIPTGTPTRTAAATAQPEEGAAPGTLEVPQTQARNMELAQTYLADPETVPYELNQLQQFAQQQAELIVRQRNEAAQLARIYQQSGTALGIQQAEALRQTINQADASLLQLQQQVVQKQLYLEGMQGLREFASANDPRRLSGVLSQLMGTPVGIQPRTDGRYNYFVNGEKVRDGITPAQLASMALREFSPEARQAASASAALENELALKSKYGDAMINAMRDIQKEVVAGEYKIAEKLAEQRGGKLISDPTNRIAYYQINGQLFIITPEGGIQETAQGPVPVPPTARIVAGLDVGQ
jgi:soluble lytic murein transglycosylase-like protein